MLSREACLRIGEAVRTAEGKTSGEIVVMVAARAGLYRSAPLLLALALGLAVPWPLIALTPWSAASIALTQAILVLAVLLLGLHPVLRLALVPRAIRRARAHEAGQREFLAHGLSATPGRTGVLIYLALAEGHAEIVADRGVAACVPAETWETVIAPLLGALRRGEMESGLVMAVERVGAILALELPPRERPVNALSNRVILVV